jgi:hypothetical protein
MQRWIGIAFFLLACLALLCLPGSAQVKPISPVGELPKSCSQEDVAKYGRPVFFPSDKGLIFGVSFPRDHYKKIEEARVHIWLSNQSTTATQMLTCCEQSFLAMIQVTDVYGRRLESGPEIFERKALEQGRTTIHVCTCSGPLTTYPVGFCGVVDQGTLNRSDTAYDLPLGTYIVEKRTPKSSPDPTSQPPHTDPKEKVAGLAITIEAP